MTVYHLLEVPKFLC